VNEKNILSLVCWLFFPEQQLMATEYWQQLLVAARGRTAPDQLAQIIDRVMALRATRSF
jgi:hypothetical protein